MATETTKTKTDKSLADEAADETAETKTSKAAEPRDAAEPQDKDEGPTAQDKATEAEAEDRAETRAEDLTGEDDDIPDPATAGGRSSWGGGAGAVVSAGLGFASLGGTPLSEMLRERKSMIGQIESSAQQGASGGSASDQVNALYGAPWHAAAVVNGIFAVLAVVVGGLLLASLSNRVETRGWVKSVALGGVVLGLIGLVISGGMYFDLFAGQPEVPSAPGQ
jgi:hypothetical protein